MAKRLNGIIVGAEAPMDRNSLWIDGTEGGISVFGNDGWKSVAGAGGVSKKYVDDQLNGYTELVPVTGRKLTEDEASFLEIDEPDSYIAVENPAGSGEKKIIIKYPIEDGRFDNTDRTVIWESMSFALIGNISDKWETVQPVSHNSNVLINSGSRAIFIPLNDNAKVALEDTVGENDDYAKVVIPDNSVFIFHTGGVLSIDPTDGNVEPMQDSGSVVVLTEETLSPVARRSDFDGYTEHKQLPVREMTAEEKKAWLNGSTEEAAAAHGFSTFMAYTNPAGSGEKNIHIKISTEKNRLVFANLMFKTDAVEPAIPSNPLFSFEDGTFDADCVVPDGVTLLIAPRCTASEVIFEDATEYDLDATFNIEITEEIEHGRVLREEDVATAKKEANLLGFIELNSTVKNYMLLQFNGSSNKGLLQTGVGPKYTLGFYEYTAYMQNYGPLNVYPTTMASAETIDGLVVDESTVEADRAFIIFIPGYALNSHVDSYEVETEQGTTVYPDKFNCFPSLVCIGKTGDEERWVCVNIPDAAGFENYRVIGGQRYIKHLAVYDAKPKLTQVAASVCVVMQE